MYLIIGALTLYISSKCINKLKKSFYSYNNKLPLVPEPRKQVPAQQSVLALHGKRECMAVQLA
jgi:hypothetical protein